MKYMGVSATDDASHFLLGYNLRKESGLTKKLLHIVAKCIALFKMNSPAIWILYSL